MGLEVKCELFLVLVLPLNSEEMGLISPESVKYPLQKAVAGK